MRRFSVLLVLVAGTAFANDHNNLEPSRPLRVEDAYSIAFGERDFQTGFGIASFQHSRPVYAWQSEFQYGFAKNRDVSFSFDRAFDGSAGDFAASYFENLTREVENSPALGYRLGVSRQGGRSANHLSLLATKAWHQYDKLHFNADLSSIDAPQFILGHSMPLGYPRVFDRTLVSEVVYQRGLTSVGVGLRLQTRAQQVLDVGVMGDAKSPLRLVAGYSSGF